MFDSFSGFFLRDYRAKSQIKISVARTDKDFACEQRDLESFYLFRPKINISPYRTDMILLQSDWLKLANQNSVPYQIVLFTFLILIINKLNWPKLKNVWLSTQHFFK